MLEGRASRISTKSSGTSAARPAPRNCAPADPRRPNIGFVVANFKLHPDERLQMLHLYHFGKILSRLRLPALASLKAITASFGCFPTAKARCRALGWSYSKSQAGA